MITKNFRLNALANQFAAALYDHVSAASNAEHFMIDVDSMPVRVELVGGIKGMRDLVDGYALEALKETITRQSGKTSALPCFPLR